LTLPAIATSVVKAGDKQYQCSVTWTNLPGPVYVLSGGSGNDDPTYVEVNPPAS
jgi:hypothetical protein